MSKPSDGSAGRRRAALIAALLLSSLAGAFLAAGPAAAAPVPSIVVEDGSTVVFADQEVIVDASLGGPRAGLVYIANGSAVRFLNATLRFVNTTADGGIRLTGGSSFEADDATIVADGGAFLTISARGNSRVALDHVDVSTLQGPTDLSVPGIDLASGSTLTANASTLMARPDVRPLVVAAQSTVDIAGSVLGGRIGLSVSVADLTRVTLTSFGEDAALSASGSTLLVEDSTVVASAGGTALEAVSGSDITVRSSNLTAEDIGLAVRSSSLATLDTVAIVAEAFGVASEDSVVTAQGVAVVGASTAVWSRHSEVSLTRAHLGSGLLRFFNASQVSIDAPTTGVGFVLLEDASTLTLTDASFDWSKVAAEADSVVVPRWRPLFEFLTEAGGNPGATVSWSVSTSSGLPVGTGTSNGNGVSRGPPLEGPRLLAGAFAKPIAYALSYTDGAVSVNTTLTAWGPGLSFPLYLAPSLPDLAFSATGLSLGDAGGAGGARINASARLTVPPGASGETVAVVVKVDGIERGRLNRTLVGTGVLVEFFVEATPGTHLVAVEVDLVGSATRGQVLETNDRGNNVVAGWYNASSTSNASIKPDLRVTDVRFEFVHTVAHDPVTGETVEAARMVVFVEIFNAGLTAAGPFDVGVAAGVNTTRTSLPRADPLANVTAIVEFGPYLRPEELVVRAEVDIDREVDESDETNNARTVPALVVVEIPDRQGPPPWALALALGAAAAVVALALWGGYALWRPDEDGEEGEAPTAGEVEPRAPKDAPA
ncbi:MAG TPA: CARDB domain-containing protein, partial [Candidatus Thermoplasmatota archaeon]